MGEENRRADPLIRAIGELRIELLGWIDERLEALQRPTGPRELAGTASTAAAEVREPAPAARPLTDPPRVPEPRTEPAAPSAGDDAGRRLENLARQLGERLRHAESPATRAEPSRQGAPRHDRA
jgi:hypothetical protein